jgi:phosphoglycerol transferase MdoB-like AlkP superfamily enzyme
VGLPRALRQAGYATLFHTGARAAFDNNALWLRRNGFDEVVTDEAFAEATERVAWGVADTIVLEGLSRALERCPRPFFAYFLSVTGHEGSLPPAYAAAHPELAQREPYFRALRYTDDALRAFFEANAGKPWFRNTLFVLVGDHQPWDLPAARLRSPSALGRAREWFQVVGLLRHPQLTPGDAPRDTSHLDIAPTILALLDLRAETECLGSSVFAPSALTHIPAQWIQRDGRLVLHRPGEVLAWDTASDRCDATDALTATAPRPCHADEAATARAFRTGFLDVIQWQVLRGER